MLTQQDIERTHVMHEGVPVSEEKLTGNLEQLLTDRPELFEARTPEELGLPDSSEVFIEPESAPEESPAAGKTALVHANSEVEYVRWAAYLKALGYDVATTQELVAREILKAVAVADLVVVTKDWYVNSTANVVLLLGRFVGADLKVAFDTDVASGGDVIQGLFDMPAASLNPIEIGKVLRNG